MTDKPLIPSQRTSIEAILDQVHKLFLEADLFYGHGSDNAWDEAVYLVMSALNMPIQGDPEQLHQILSEDQISLIHDWTEQRINSRQPLPYITGKAYFCGLEFEVNEDVLIPRSPIAELIDSGFSPWLDEEPAAVLDLCTGCGCIAIACAYAFPDAKVVATDISSSALKVASRNLQQHNLENRMCLFQGDLFQAVSDSKQRYDLIVSNPPYVDDEDMLDLPDEFKREPELALVAGNDGLDLVRIMLSQASRYLSKKGILVIEVGNSAAALEKAFPKVPFTWIDFEYGGDGVFVLDKQQLIEYFDTEF